MGDLKFNYTINLGSDTGQPPEMPYERLVDIGMGKNPSRYVPVRIFEIEVHEKGLCINQIGEAEHKAVDGKIDLEQVRIKGKQLSLERTGHDYAATAGVSDDRYGRYIGLFLQKSGQNPITTTYQFGDMGFPEESVSTTSPQLTSFA